MGLIEKLAKQNDLKSINEVHEYIVDSYIIHDSLDNFILYVNKLDKKERARLSNYILMHRPHLEKWKIDKMINALIDHPQKIV